MDIKNTPHKQWIKLGIVLVLYGAFLLWVKSWLGLIVVPFIFDCYITHFIKWGFWRKWTNGTARYIMGWVDAIIFAAIAVTFVNLFVFQIYQIPSSSLEKSLLVGDYLCVSKLSYGPRVPNTPLSMPLTQHTLPIVNTKSYIEWPHWAYKRVAGLGKVERGDIVVFNFPAGDTVALNQQQSDFYSLAYFEGRRKYRSTINLDSLTRQQQRVAFDIYYNAGRKSMMENEAIYGKIVTRPVDKRENYVKRCVGLPGDTLQIIDTHVYINGEATKDPENMQLNYLVQTTGSLISDDMFRELGISNDDRQLLASGNAAYLTTLGLDATLPDGQPAPVYCLPLTKKMLAALEGNKKLVAKIVMEPEEDYGFNEFYPLNLHKKWNRNDYGPIWIPCKGATIKLTADNLPVYERCIRAYEGNTLDINDDGIYINGEKTDEYTFKMDYYWMMGDNRHKSADSRYWGFVPEDHIVGKPLTVLMSLDKDRSLFDGHIRWNRVFKSVDKIK